MPTFDDIWTDKMYTGIDHIDEHHKKLVRLLLAVHAEQQAGGSHERLREILAELVSYTKYHFAAEERLMLEIKYPGLPEQRQAHQDFCSELNDRFLSLSIKDERLPAELFEFLRGWYADHILKHDLDIGVFIRSQARLSGHG